MEFDGLSPFQIGFEEEVKYFEEDTQTIKSDEEFKWTEIPKETMDKKSALMKIFNDALKKKFSNRIFFLLNVKTFTNILSYDYINLITDYPDFTHGTKEYNFCQLFFTELIFFLNNFHLKKDFLLLDKIDAEDIESTSPVMRHQLRIKNSKNEYVIQKYFQNGTMVTHLAYKCVENFIIGATWRWIGGNHRSHVYSVEIYKILIENGLMSESDLIEMQQILFIKIHNLLSLEKYIEADKVCDIYWINDWAKDLRLIREYYAEIIINFIYYKQDFEIIEKITKIKSTDKLKKQDELLSFEESILFDDDFGKKILSFVIGYILNQNKVNFLFYEFIKCFFFFFKRLEINS